MLRDDIFHCYNGVWSIMLFFIQPKMSKLRDPLRIALEGLANLKEALANLKNST